MGGVRFSADDLRPFAATLLERGGLAADRAADVADILVEGDLLGKTTHGLQLMTPYMNGVEDGGMNLAGDFQIVADTGAAFTWDGDYLAGPWLVLHAMQEAERRVREHGIVTGVIRRTHHIGALQAYLLRATEMNLMMVLMASDPREESVAPHGGLAGRYSPNPIAIGIPTQTTPILIDVSLSTTAKGAVNRANNEGRRLGGPWLKDAAGKPTDDPSVLFSEPKGAQYPLGGADLGFKGFGLGIMIEALTAALGGHGRADRPKEWGASVFLQLIDPDCFAGMDSFLRESTFLADYFRATPVAEGDPPVQMPGDRALQRRNDQLSHGVELHAGIMDALKKWGGKYGVEAPAPL
ncbi:MAG: Ldh family oxidoreductase [Rhodospirillales bacterium]|jgi:LDH2 family malate/lactate/ureidoglycolate dehydrogenase|nr:Ldh family oxidoreductase [Rhodospirillales bacterium]